MLGFNFSWKRLLGITRLKTKLSRKTGIPLSKASLQRELGRRVLKLGWRLLIVAVAALFGGYLYYGDTVTNMNLLDVFGKIKSYFNI
jgi:hypothetical protein